MFKQRSEKASQAKAWRAVCAPNTIPLMAMASTPPKMANQVKTWDAKHWV